LHLYHSKGVGVNSEDFGITQVKLIKIQDEGFLRYVQRGNKLPSIEHVRTYQKALKEICLDPSTETMQNIIVRMVLRQQTLLKMIDTLCVLTRLREI
jgi:DNA/RNA-binding domain of Phe-tRNA-synthetase-like protein